MNYLSIPQLLIIILCMYIHSSLAGQSQLDQHSIQEKLSLLESNAHIHLGVSAINTANNQTINYHAHERFPMQCTSKLIGVSAILHRSETEPSFLQQKIFYKKEDLVFWSPITGKNFKEGMTISELCAAAMMYSDNTAINLLVKKLGGLNAVTQFARFLKDNSFRLDHWETHLNSNPLDAEDSSTPSAMQHNLKKLVLGNALSKTERDLLVNWMKHNTTGDTRIRAGVPKGWIVADKTGSSETYGNSNDIAVIWPPNRSPIVLAIYSIHSDKNAARRDDIVAAVTRLVITEFNKTTSEKI